MQTREHEYVRAVAVQSENNTDGIVTAGTNKSKSNATLVSHGKDNDGNNSAIAAPFSVHLQPDSNAGDASAIPMEKQSMIQMQHNDQHDTHNGNLNQNDSQIHSEFNHTHNHHSNDAHSRTEICFVVNCNAIGSKQCAGLRIQCWNFICDEHGCIAHKQHWCGGGGCGLTDNDKYCDFCKRKANRESWMKLSLIFCTILILAIIILVQYLNS